MLLNLRSWILDTGASSHLTSDAGNLNSRFNSSFIQSVIVGDGSLIPVTQMGHSQIANPYRPLYLRNVLVTPNIIKNLISVRQFTKDNKCSIEFDPYGFSIKDLKTRQLLLRSDSTGDLYPISSQHASAFSILSHNQNHSVWHQRLGHPGDTILQSLASKGFISYHKDKTSTLCHACQLGKQIKLPFYRSESIVKSPFGIVHSDIWTSPIPSVSGFKYYVLFLDHFSHFLWIYPLHRKSDAFSKFVQFRAFVRTQFNREIRAFQCDHGGEFDNRSMHDLFATNGIQFRFSCPHTSQQNGKSERMIRTINNVIRTLLFQAHLPPEY